MVYPLVLITLSFDLIFNTLVHMLHSSNDFIHHVHDNNTKRYTYLQRQFHWSKTRWIIEQRKFHRPILALCPLEYGVYSDVVNLDRFNLFLLGIHYYSSLAILSSIVLIQDLSWMFTRALQDVVTIYFSKRPKKPPDIVFDKSVIKDKLSVAEDTSFVACTSTLSRGLDDSDIYNDHFDTEDTFVVGLDSLCSRHLFPDKSDFVSTIIPIEHLEVQGVGGGIKAIGKGTVRIRFRCDQGILHDKLLRNAYFAPTCPVRLISIPQLARDPNETSSLCTGGNKSTFTWVDIRVTVSHPSPSDVPFMTAYLGNPTYSAFCSLCAFAQNPLSEEHQSIMGASPYQCFHMADNFSGTDPLTINRRTDTDIIEHLECKRTDPTECARTKRQICNGFLFC
jgi:hypothetical protein